MNLVNTTIELAPSGKIPPGVTEIPFEMPLRARQAISPGYPGLLETYHGVFVNIMYNLKCSMKRSFLNKPLNTSCQVFVQYKHVSHLHLLESLSVFICPIIRHHPYVDYKNYL